MGSKSKNDRLQTDFYEISASTIRVHISIAIRINPVE